MMQTAVVPLLLYAFTVDGNRKESSHSHYFMFVHVWEQESANSCVTQQENKRPYLQQKTQPALS